MNQQQSQQQSGAFSSNMGYLNQTALELRLETKEILERIQIFLSGETSATLQDETTGKIRVQKIKIGKKLMNEEGVSHISNYVSSIINPAVVQGNYSEDWYRQQIERTHKNLAYIITVNTPYWEIEETARHSIIDFIMELVKPFLSRLIDNKERESYVATIRTTESNTTTMRDSGLLNKVGIN